jgi:hypothetical protein
VWARSENFNPAQVADYASKLVAAGIPVPMVAEEIGWSPQRVDQLRAELATNAFLAAATGPVPVEPTAGQPNGNTRSIPPRANTNPSPVPSPPP